MIFETWNGFGKQSESYSKNDEELGEIELLIFEGHATLVHLSHGRPGAYELTWKDFNFYAVYEYETYKIITFLTKEMGFKGSDDQ